MKMNTLTENSFNEIIETIKSIAKEVKNLPVELLQNYSVDNTVILIVDMINGFTKFGNLYSDRSEKNITQVKEILKKASNYKKIFIADNHNEDSTEFLSYPKHCIKNTPESEIVDELKDFLDENSIIINKNSTNAMFSSDFINWIKSNKGVTNFIIMGVCTDICVEQLAMGLKAYFNENNINSKIVIPVNAVETYQLEQTLHNADLMNLVSLYNMKNNGIELVKNIK